jgi:hypothetical protein
MTAQSFGQNDRLSFRVVAGLVPAASMIVAQRLANRGRRDKPGDDGSGVIQSDQKPL